MITHCTHEIVRNKDGSVPVTNNNVNVRDVRIVYQDTKKSRTINIPIFSI